MIHVGIGLSNFVILVKNFTTCLLISGSHKVTESCTYKYEVGFMFKLLKLSTRVKLTFNAPFHLVQ